MLQKFRMLQTFPALQGILHILSQTEEKKQNRAMEWSYGDRHQDPGGFKGNFLEAAEERNEGEQIGRSHGKGQGRGRGRERSLRAGFIIEKKCCPGIHDD